MKHKSDFSKPGANTPINYTYYPIISESHPDIDKLREYQSRKRDQNKHPSSPVAAPKIRTFAVLIKTTRFKRLNDIPARFERGEAVEGMVINRIEHVDMEERKLLKQTFPDVDLDGIVILEDGREPTSRMQSLVMMIAGSLLCVFGLVLVIRGMIIDNREPPPKSAGIDPPTQDAASV